MTILISDANILIDVVEGRIVDPFFQLPFVICVPDLLFVDELADFHSDLPEKGLVLKELEPNSLEKAMHLQQRYKKSSRYDCLALALAVQEDCPLLTGDQDLRDAGVQENIDVHGTLWLVDIMIEKEVITLNTAYEAYKLMYASGRRLPWKQVWKRFKT
ncbi:MAG: PIN domain-containing protein [Desulfovermiculus sp.]|nr:PIN domain-containing protein [Desulfovermiculus sp.]